MKLLSRITVSGILFFSFSSFNVKTESTAERDLGLCDGVKKIIGIFAEGEIDQLLEGKIVSADETQWSSKVKIERYKNEFIYENGDYSYFEAEFDYKMNSADALKKELHAIVASLGGCLQEEPELREYPNSSTRFFLVGEVLVSVSGKHINSEDRSIMLKIRYDF